MEVHDKPKRVTLQANEISEIIYNDFHVLVVMNNGNRYLLTMEFGEKLPSLMVNGLNKAHRTWIELEPGDCVAAYLGDA